MQLDIFPELAPSYVDKDWRIEVFFPRADRRVVSTALLLSWCKLSCAGRESTHATMSTRRQPIADLAPAPLPRRIGFGNSGSNHGPSASSRLRMVDGLRLIWSATSSMRHTSLFDASNLPRYEPRASLMAVTTEVRTACRRLDVSSLSILRLCVGDQRILQPRRRSGEVGNPHFEAGWPTETAPQRGL